MTKNTIIKSLLGDDTSPFIADELKSSYEDLLSDLNDISNGEPTHPIFSTDPFEEKQQLLEMLAAFRLVHSWYSCTPIES